MAMGYPIPIDKEKMVYAETTAKVSPKKAVVVARKINGKKFLEAKKFLEDLLAEKVSINGKYYTNPTKEILRLFKSVEANAKFRGFDLNELWIKTINVNRGPTIYRRRRKSAFGARMKISNIKIVLERR
jgi:ribosomal protein L22